LNVATTPDINSKRTRVEPIFGWLRDHGDSSWPGDLLGLADGLKARIETGELESLSFEEEVQVAASPTRLAWMIRNAEGLAPVDGKRWRELYARVIDDPEREQTVTSFERGELKRLPASMTLEGPSHADCLIECEWAVIWVEGKRHDWLSPSTTWDVTRDQVARNLEAARAFAKKTSKNYCLIVCHEYPLKHHEQLLLDGYRAETWTGGWPHLAPDVHHELSARIGTVTWNAIANRWPLLRQLPALHDLA
jgi:hypothetical protein